MPTLAELANELGIDPATLAAKGDVVTKWNGYFADADTKYQTATQAQKDAQAKLEQAQREQQIINDQITSFGVTEASLAELRASNAAYAAAFEEVKKQGLSVNMPNLPVNTPKPVDPNQILQDKVTQGFSLFGQALKVQNTFQEIHGKPFTGDIEALAAEAQSNRMGLFDYAARKFDFEGERTKRTAAAAAAHDAEVSAAAVKKYQEDHPSQPEKPGFSSQHPQIFKPRTDVDQKTFRNLPAKERLAQSVARGRALAATLDA